jgi:peptidoglycan/LPS O-acetylase OafA/YrhL
LNAGLPDTDQVAICDSPAVAPSSRHPRSPRYTGLTGARFFAALLPPFYHLQWFNRDVAVSFFFVLSGFSLCFSRTNSCVDFYRRRFLRIYPLYVFGLLLAIPGLIYHFNGFGVFLLAPFLLQSWVPSLSLVWNGPGWSLSCLAFFYLLMPFLVRSRLATGILAAFLPLAMRVPISYSHLPIVNLPQFCVGVLGGLCFSKKARVTWVVPAIVCVLVLAFVPLPQAALHNGVLAPLFLWLMFALTGVKYCPRWLVTLGNSSYALIILHYPILFAFKFAMRRATLPTLAGAIYLVVAVTFAVFAYKYVDPPLRRALQRTLPWLRVDADARIEARVISSPATSAALSLHCS